VTSRAQKTDPLHPRLTIKDTSPSAFGASPDFEAATAALGYPAGDGNAAILPSMPTKSWRYFTGLRALDPGGLTAVHFKHDKIHYNVLFQAHGAIRY
jgi:hypothetical protein